MGEVGLLVMTWFSIGPCEWVTEERLRPKSQKGWRLRNGEARVLEESSQTTQAVKSLEIILEELKKWEQAYKLNFSSVRERDPQHLWRTATWRVLSEKVRWADTQSWVFSAKWEWKQPRSRARKRCNTTSCPVIKWVWERSQVSLLGMNNLPSLTQSHFQVKLR